MVRVREVVVYESAFSPDIAPSDFPSLFNCFKKFQSEIKTMFYWCVLVMDLFCYVVVVCVD